MPKKPASGEGARVGGVNVHLGAGGGVNYCNLTKNLNSKLVLV